MTSLPSLIHLRKATSCSFHGIHFCSLTSFTFSFCSIQHINQRVMLCACLFCAAHHRRLLGIQGADSRFWTRIDYKIPLTVLTSLREVCGSHELAERSFCTHVCGDGARPSDVRRDGCHLMKGWASCLHLLILWLRTLTPCISPTSSPIGPSHTGGARRYEHEEHRKPRFTVFKT